MTKVSRRRVLRGLSVLPIGIVVVSCGGKSAPAPGDDAPESAAALVEPAAPPPPAAPEPFIVAEGEERRALLAGTPYEAPLRIFGSGRPGPIVMALGGVHGNEPGGWLAAERIAANVRPSEGALLILPRANRIAISLFERTTADLGDLNRLYPGNPDGLPMERMAFEIVQALRDFHVNVLVDMHESWAFYKDRPQNGTAFLGQTVATNPVEPGISLARGVVEAVNQHTLYAHEELFFREFPPGRLPDPMSVRPFDTTGNLQAAASGGSRSSLGLYQHVAGLTSILVEMGQQQALERRIALHMAVLTQVMRAAGNRPA